MFFREEENVREEHLMIEKIKILFTKKLKKKIAEVKLDKTWNKGNKKKIY